jgi:DNA (cytosine-5)-methyltransferase 1
MRGLSLFSGGGLGESSLNEIGVTMIVANEILPERREIFEAMNPHTPLVTGDIRSGETKSALAKRSKGIDLLLATPPCQGVSVAGKNRTPASQLGDPRNYLLFDTLDMVLKTLPRFVVIENVPQFIRLALPFENRLVPVPDLIQIILGKYYDISINLLSTATLGVPQDRKRSFITLWQTGEPAFEAPAPSPVISVRESIGDLPSLESGEASDIPWHFARKHLPRQVEWMRNTPSGETAFDNPLHFPKGKDGKPIKAFRSTYRRMKWDTPAPVISMRNDAISSQANVHPGRLLGSGIYSDARVLTPRELLVLSSVNPEKLPEGSVTEANLRKAIGEGLPPQALNRLVSGFKR